MVPSNSFDDGTVNVEKAEVSRTTLAVAKLVKSIYSKPTATA